MFFYYRMCSFILLYYTFTLLFTILLLLHKCMYLGKLLYLGSEVKAENNLIHVYKLNPTDVPKPYK